MSMCGVQSNQVDGITWYSRVRRKKAKSGGEIRGCLKSVRRIICTTESRKGRGDSVAINVLGQESSASRSLCRRSIGALI